MCAAGARRRAQPGRSGGPGLLWFELIQMTARRGVQLLAPLVRAFSPVQQCTPAARSLPCLQLPLRAFASDADLKKTPLYDFHVEHGGEAHSSVGWISLCRTRAGRTVADGAPPCTYCCPPDDPSDFGSCCCAGGIRVLGSMYRAYATF